MSIQLRRALLTLALPLLAAASCGSNIPDFVKTAPTPSTGRAAAAQDPKPAPTPAMPTLQDAPHLFVQEDGGVEARWITDGVLQTRSFAKGQPVDLPEWADLLGAKWIPADPVVPKCQWDAPAKMLVLSDVEGEYDALRRLLRNNGVIDANGAWAFGDGHLVGVGDMVDRGDHVTEVLWLFYRLSREAAASGGHVHFVLGNHEAMMMGGDVRYTNPKYFHAAKLMGVTCQGLLGADTVIGRWLRSCNCIERIGDHLFVHAGLSPPVVGQKLDYEGINEKVRSVLGKNPNTLSDVRVLELSWGRLGPLWYRGYFPQHVLNFGPTPSNAQFRAILEACAAKHIVVGHTKVPHVATMYEGGLIPIDVPWTYPQNVRALVVEGGKARLVDIEGVSSTLR